MSASQPLIHTRGDSTRTSAVLAAPARATVLDDEAQLALGAVKLAHLRTFLAVAHERHFGRAAAQGYLAQPAVSRQVRRLEHQVGVQLLDRHARGVTPTPAGRALILPAGRALDMLAVAVAAARGGGTTFAPLSRPPEFSHLQVFVAVARTLSFTAAGRRLDVEQSSVSRRLRELEARIGVELVARTPRHVGLTPAGRAFLPHARRVIGDVTAGMRAARRAGLCPTRRLVIGHLLGAALELTAPILAEFVRSHPDVELQLLESPWDDPSAGLVDARVDVAFVRLPLTGASELVGVPLFAEPRIAVMPVTHPLAEAASVSMAELGGEPMVVPLTADPAWRAFCAGSGHPAVHAVDLQRAYEATSRRGAITLAPVSAARTMLEPGTTFVPTAGVEPSIVAAAYRRSLCDPLADDFISIADRVRAGATGLLDRIEAPLPERTSRSACRARPRLREERHGEAHLGSGPAFGDPHPPAVRLDDGP